MNQLRFHLNSSPMFPFGTFRLFRSSSRSFIVFTILCLSFTSAHAQKPAPLGKRHKINTGSTFDHPIEVVIGPSGNLFVLDQTTGIVSEIFAVNGVIPPSPIIKTLANGTPFQHTYSIAIDAHGNLFLPAGPDFSAVALYEIPVSNRNGNPILLGGTFDQPKSLAIDSSGNIFITETGSNYDIKEVAAAGGYKTVTIAITGLATPSGLAIDPNGNIFVASDFGSIQEFAASSNYRNSITLPVSFSSILNLAADEKGNVYATDAIGQSIHEIFASSDYKTEITFKGKFKELSGVAIAADGSIFVSDILAGIDEIQRIPVNFGLQVQPLVVFGSRG